MWGLNSCGQCGVKPEAFEIVSPPIRITYSKYGQNDVEVPQRTLLVACGGEHTLLLSQDNDVWGLGANSSGQLGLSSIEFAD